MSPGSIHGEPPPGFEETPTKAELVMRLDNLKRDLDAVARDAAEHRAHLQVAISIDRIAQQWSRMNDLLERFVAAAEKEPGPGAIQPEGKWERR